MNEFGLIALKIGFAALLAGLVGAERQWTGKFAGLRTHMSIAVGAALLTHISHSSAAGASWDGGRIAAQIVSGIGFIGAGTIIRSRGSVHGLTTAAGLWVAAAIGIAVGGEFYAAAATTTLALLFILVALRPIERRLSSHVRTVELRLPEGQKLAQVMDLLEAAGIDASEVSVERGMGRPTVRVCFHGTSEDARRLVQLANLEGFDAVEEADTAGSPMRPAGSTSPPGP
ncbi:MAG TPA: MgtC/SapB family protein [Thermoanaerobaculia bacterium]|nr:MgtC/SapB family protein [Thermoanaerobaculia bacterium]